MGKRKKVRQRGKIRFSEYFKELKEGEKVALKKEKSLNANFPERMQGKTGVVSGKRGSNFIVKVKDFKREKTYIVPSIHLLRIKEKKEAGANKEKKQ